MSDEDTMQLERLWDEYGQFLNSWDDLTLSRWISQTLGQIEGHVWRASHPLVGVFRLAAVAAHRRGIPLRRHARIPDAYQVSECCGMPLLPLVTRDVLENGLICPFCDQRLLGLQDLSYGLGSSLGSWAEAYAKVHEIAHWSEEEKRQHGDYDRAFNQAAQQAEDLLAELATEILPPFLEEYPAVIWEDHDECLDIRTDDIVL